MISKKSQKIVAIHQPYFMPWLGFFDKVARADIFIVLGNATCDWQSRSVLSRNKIKTPAGAKWLTIPIHADLKTRIKDVKIDENNNWRKDHLKTLFFNYKRRRIFQNYIL